MFEQFNEYIQYRPLLAFIVAYFGGILTSFTPCVFPVIPITVAVLGLEHGGSRVYTCIRALVYVMGMAIIYAILGVVAALTGQLFGSISVHPITNVIVALICVVFALAMLGMIGIPLPQFLTHRRNRQEESKGLFGVFVMGATSGTIVAPCTAPVLGTLLTFVSTSKSIVYGSLLLFAYAVGLGTLLIIIGTFSGMLTSLPKSGKWMVVVQRILGVFMMFVAVYFLYRAWTFR